MESEAREREKLFLEAERKKCPELFRREPQIDNAAACASIGISFEVAARPLAYLKLFPQDFIVEEIGPDGAESTVAYESSAAGAAGTGPTVYADLVKAGVSTFEARAALAERLGIAEEQIGYAGIKDRFALTSQRISIRGASDLGRVRSIADDRFFLKKMRCGKGVVETGALRGNRFTILLRLPRSLSAEESSAFEAAESEVREHGFWNFFSFQRFGTPRLLSHRLGRLIMRGAYEDAVKLFMTEPAPREIPYFQGLRRKIGAQWGNWQAMRELLEPFPGQCALERTFADFLVCVPGDFAGALRTAPDQIRLWIFAWSSYLFNRKLSELIRLGDVPLSLPLPTSANQHDWETYASELRDEDVRLPSRAFKDFPFVQHASRRWPTVERADITQRAARENVFAWSFSLPKGAYATTFLMHFFTLTSGLPLITGIPTGPVDVLELLGSGTLGPVLGRFSRVLAERQNDIELWRE